MNIGQNVAGRWLAVGGSVCQLAFVVGLLRLAPFLGSFFSTLIRSGIGDPSSLGAAFEEFFEYGAAEFVFGLAGLICLGISLAVCRYRAGWFFRFLTGYSVFLLCAFPVGTAFGIFFLVYCRARREEFRVPGTAR